MGALLIVGAVLCLVAFSASFVIFVLYVGGG